MVRQRRQMWIRSNFGHLEHLADVRARHTHLLFGTETHWVPRAVRSNLCLCAIVTMVVVGRSELRSGEVIPDRDGGAGASQDGWRPADQAAES